MTNPTTPKGDEDNLDRSRKPENKAEPPELTLTDLVSRERADAANKAAQPVERKEAPSVLPELRATGPQFTYQLGKHPQFQMRKSEFLPKIEKPVQELKPLIDQFLKATSVQDDNHLSPAELNELTQTRESLSRFTDPNDALSKVLHLAKLYQHVQCVEEAKAATNLSLGIDPENHVGKELFKELERVHPVDVGSRMRAPSQGLNKTALRKRIQALSGGRVVVVGDHLIDELLEGKPERISREAPVLILEHVDTELIPGGASNTANNIAALGGKCHAIGVCGKDEYAAKLEALFDKVGISHSLVQDPSRPTTVKTRILSRSHSFQQQLLRLDRISHEPVSALVEGMLIDRIHQSAAGFYQAIILSDYKGGAITDGVIRACRSAAETNRLMVIVDAQDRPERFQNVTLMTPNQPDAEKMIGYELNTQEALERGGKDLLLLTGAKAVLITRGAAGMVLFEENKPMMQLPVFNKSEVFDVTGAGDTVVAVMALVMVTGGTFLEAMALGNLAAGIVVRKHGTAVTSQKEMLENLELIYLED